VWARVALLLASCAIALGLGELALRMLRPQAVRLVEYPCIYEDEGSLGYRYRPGATGRIAGNWEIRINSLGFHDAEPLADAGPRVVAVGDSFTAALGVLRSQNWVAVLERALQERVSPRADVVSLGIDGTGTDVHVDLLKRWLPELRPQVVILAFYANDVGDVLNGRFRRECYRGWVLSYPDDAWRATLRARVDAHLERRTARWLFDHSYLFRLLTSAVEGDRTLFRWRFLQPTRAELGLDRRTLARRRPRLRRVFAELEALADDCDCRLLVIPVPPRGDLEGSLRVFRKADPGSKLEVVDVVPAMRAILERDGRPPEALHGVRDVHLNVYGNKVFGEAIAESVDWESLLSPDAKRSAGSGPSS
jgi:lysophospholipase L1-like esterase